MAAAAAAAAAISESLFFVMRSHVAADLPPFEVIKNIVDSSLKSPHPGDLHSTNKVRITDLKTGAKRMKDLP